MADTRHGGRVRGLVLFVFYLGVLGVGAELLLLGHIEDWKQWIPLGLLAMSCGMAPIVARRPSRPVLRLFQLLMLLFVVGGGVGIYLHYSGNAEFEREMYPAIEGFELVKEALTGATPALAPGAMAHLGLLGLAFSYRHPMWFNDVAR